MLDPLPCLMPALTPVATTLFLLAGRSSLLVSGLHPRHTGCIDTAITDLLCARVGASSGEVPENCYRFRPPRARIETSLGGIGSLLSGGPGICGSRAEPYS